MCIRESCDIIPERAKGYAEKFNVPAWYTSIDELLEKCSFEILMNTTSIPAHQEINMKALRAGKHLYSQKPVGLTVEQVTEQMEAAKASGVKYSASPIHMPVSYTHLSCPPVQSKTPGLQTADAAPTWASPQYLRSRFQSRRSEPCLLYTSFLLLCR